MFNCPACGTDDIHNRLQCRCGEDLSLLHFVDGLGNHWFNRALQALEAGQPGQALEWMSACCVLNPNDAAARRAQSKLWAQLGCLDDARRALQSAADLDPDHPEVEMLREVLGGD